MSINPDTLAALQSKNYSYIVGLIRFDFTSVGGGVIALSTAQFDVPWGGDVFVGSGLVLSVGNVGETSEIRIEPTSFDFSGADLTLTAIFLQNDYTGAPVWYARAVLDGSYQVIGEPIIYLIDTIDGPGGTQDDDEARIIIETQGPFANFEANNGRRMNPHDIERVFPGDKGGEFSGEPLQRGVWGRKS